VLSSSSMSIILSTSTIPGDMRRAIPHSARWGQRLRTGIRKDDGIGRYGGEEFAILLSDI